MKVQAMLWILVLVSVAIAILSPRLRPYSLVAAGVVILAIVAIVVFANQGESLRKSFPRVAMQPPIQQSQHIDFEQFHIENLDKGDPEAKTRIGVAEIRFDEIRAEQGSEPGSIRSIRARLYNNSARYTLTDYAYYLAVQDCVKSVCTTIYDQRGQAAALVPANQARDIIIMVNDGEKRGVPALQILGTQHIKLLPTTTRAYQTALTRTN